MTLPLPRHFEPSTVEELRIERSAHLAEEAVAFRSEHGLRPAEGDGRRIGAFGIDAQITFCHPAGGLFVPGAVEDTARATAWLYRNLDRISGLVFSLDTHEVYQIFHPAFWADASGVSPPPFTPITASEVREGRWTPRAHREEALAYCEQLEAAGRYVLTIWPYHGLLGGLGHALMPSLMEAALFHAFARDAKPHFAMKGRAELTEMYSVLAPEVREVGGRTLGGFDETLFEHLLSFDDLYVFGQASSHCVLATLEDLEQALTQRGRSAELSKIVLLEDATSPVQPPPLDPLPEALDFPRVAQTRIDALVRRGMRRSRTTDPLLR